MNAPVPYVVIVTGHPGAGKSTLGPRLARALGAVCISRDAIHSMIFDGWEPRHPGTVERYDPVVDGNVFLEGKVNWSVFLWTIEQVVAVAPVVAESPFNHHWARERFAAARDRWSAPTVEVALVGDAAVLLERVRRRAAAPDAHTIKAKYTVEGAERLLIRPFVPVLDAADVVTVDTTDLDAVDVDAIAADVRALVD